MKCENETLLSRDKYPRFAEIVDKLNGHEDAKVLTRAQEELTKRYDSYMTELMKSIKCARAVVKELEIQQSTQKKLAEEEEQKEEEEKKSERLKAAKTKCEKEVNKWVSRNRSYTPIRHLANLLRTIHEFQDILPNVAKITQTLNKPGKSIGDAYKKAALVLHSDRHVNSPTETRAIAEELFTIVAGAHDKAFPKPAQVAS